MSFKVGDQVLFDNPKIDKLHNRKGTITDIDNSGVLHYRVDFGEYFGAFYARPDELSLDLQYHKANTEWLQGMDIVMNEMKGDSLDIGNISEKQTFTCDKGFHSYKKYTGFTHVYEYCTECDFKKY